MKQKVKIVAIWTNMVKLANKPGVSCKVMLIAQLVKKLVM